MDSSTTATTVAVDPRHVSYTHLMYALHATAILIGLLSTAFIVTKFIFGLPSIIAVILNYARRNEVRGTWLESHFRWQLRTFWTAVVIVVFCAPLVFTVILIPVVMIVFALLGVWAAYRIARGWLALKDGRTLPVGAR
jgi:uncharacterized membrane protein